MLTLLPQKLRLEESDGNRGQIFRSSNLRQGQFCKYGISLLAFRTNGPIGLLLRRPSYMFFWALFALYNKRISIFYSIELAAAFRLRPKSLGPIKIKAYLLVMVKVFRFLFYMNLVLEFLISII